MAIFNSYVKLPEGNLREIQTWGDGWHRNAKEGKASEGEKPVHFFDTFFRSPNPWVCHLHCLVEDAAIDAIWPDIGQAEHPCI